MISPILVANGPFHRQCLWQRMAISQGMFRDFHPQKLAVVDRALAHSIFTQGSIRTPRRNESTVPPRVFPLAPGHYIFGLDGTHLFRRATRHGSFTRCLSSFNATMKSTSPSTFQTKTSARVSRLDFKVLHQKTVRLAGYANVRQTQHPN